MTKVATGRNMRIFYLIWLGQNISALGSQLTAFAIGVWVLRATDSATFYSLMSFFAILPGMIALPLIGPLVDRWDRRRVLLLSDVGAGLATLVIVALLAMQRLEVWHLYVVMGLQSIFSSFQWPALSASITHLVPKEQYVRANGLLQTGAAAAQIASPLLAGILTELIDVTGVIAIDFASFVFSIVTLLIIRFPSSPSVSDEAKGTTSLWQESVYGWRYITSRAGLLGLLLLLALVNFSTSVLTVLMPPLILKSASATDLGTILSTGGMGMLVGSVLISVWGARKYRIQLIFGATLGQALLIFVVGFPLNVPLIAAGAFLFMFCNPLVTSASQGIWQSKVAPHVQGRVFAIRRMIAMSTIPLAYLVAGPLAEYVFEPLLMDGTLANSIGLIVGTGPGSGIRLMFILQGAVTMIIVAACYLNPRVRLVEGELPDAADKLPSRTASTLGEA